MKNNFMKSRSSYGKIFGVSIIALFMALTAISAVVLFATPVEAGDPECNSNSKWLQLPDLSEAGLDVDATAYITQITDDNTNFGSRDNEAVAFPVTSGLTLDGLFAGSGLSYTYTIINGGTNNGASPAIVVIDLLDGRHVILYPGWGSRTGTHTLTFSDTTASDTGGNNLVEFAVYDAAFSSGWWGSAPDYPGWTGTKAKATCPVVGTEVVTRIAIQHQAANTGETDRVDSLTFDGITYNFATPQILADDFLCMGTEPITDIHIWGSWLDDYLPFGEDPTAVAFTLSIHADIPDGAWSMPGELLWLQTFQLGEFDVSIYADNLVEGWYNPCEQWYEPLGDTVCWKYDFYIDPAEAFVQEGTPENPVVYWLDVQAQPLDPQARFGWKTSLDHWNDDAVYAVGMEGDHGPWFELRYPEGHPYYLESIDLAFEITTKCDYTPPVITKTHPEEGYISIPDTIISFIQPLEGVDPDTSGWSAGGNTVDLGTNTWSLLGGTATVTGYQNGGSGPLTHRGTRGLGVKGGGNPDEPDEVDSLDKLERIEITFDTPQYLKYLEVRSLFDTGAVDDPVEEGDIDLYLGITQVGYYHLVATEAAGNGVVTVSVPNILVDKIVFYIEHPSAYSGYSELAVAKIILSNPGYLKVCAPIILDAEDILGPCPSGVEGIFWRYEYEDVSYPEDGGEPGVISGTDLEALYGYTDPMITGYWWYVEYDDHVEIHFKENCTHDLYYWAKDNSCNHGPIHHQVYYVDGAGPEQTVEFGTPQESYWSDASGENTEYTVIGPFTPIWISSTDVGECAAGSKELHYYIQYGEEYGSWPGVSVEHKIVYDGGTGDQYTTDITPAGDGIITVEIYEDESCWHQVHYWCYDLLDNRQPEGTGVHYKDFIVDADAPTYTIEFEGPTFEDDLWIGDCTKKWINVTDVGCTDYVTGVNHVEWYIHRILPGEITEPWLNGIVTDWKGGGSPGDGYLNDIDPDDGEISFWIKVPEDCEHYICWRCWDDMGNYDIHPEITTPNKQRHKVDVTNPISELGVTGDQCQKDPDEYCVTKSTVISITTTNVGTPPCIYPEYWTFFRIYVEDEDKWYPDENGLGNYDGYGAAAERQFWKDKWWYVYTDPFSFTEECNHILEFFAKDPLCNTEETHVYYFYVDEQSPVIIKTIHAPNYATCDTCTNDLINPGFETADFTGWTIDAVTDSVTVVTADSFTSPYTGTYMARLGDDNGGVDGYQDPGPNQISQVFTVNQNTFAFAYNIFTYDYIGYNHFEYQLETADGKTTIAYYFQGAWGPDGDTSLKSTGWTVVAIDVSNFMGQQLKFTITCSGTSDDAYSTWVYVDCAPNTGIFVRPDTIIEIDAADMGCCDVLSYVGYNVNDGGWVPIIGQLPFDYWFNEECVHTLQIKALDCLGHETIHTETFYVDGTPPIHSKEVGDPKCTYDDCNQDLCPTDYCITPLTPIWINATDDGKEPCIVESYYIHWEVYNVTGSCLYDSGVSHNQDVIIYIGETCEHIVRYWVEDNLGNRWPLEGWHEETFYVDDSHFEFDKIVDIPNCPNPDQYADYCVTTETKIKFKMIHVDKCCPCPATFEYRVWNDGNPDAPWVNVDTLGMDGNYYVFYFGEECFHHLDLRAYDCLGHINYHNETFYVDDQAPEIIKTVGDPNCDHEDCGCIGEGDYCVTTDTLITLGYIDHGCCPSVITIEYMIEIWDGGAWQLLQGWTEYTGSFTFEQECKHQLTVRAYDCLFNGHDEEDWDIEIFYVDDTPPTIEKDVGEPQCPVPGQPGDYYVTTYTEICVDAHEEGCCPCDEVDIDYRIQYNEEWSEWTDYDECITFNEECVHVLEIRARDCLGNTNYHTETFYVDDTPPVTVIDYDAVAPGWIQMSEEGFEDLTNDYAWSMAVYTVDETEYLYVGTLNTDMQFQQLPQPGDGAEVWRTNGTIGADGKYVWECVVGLSGSLQAPAGFMGVGQIYGPETDPSFAVGARGMTIHEGLLWVGTMPLGEIFVTNGTAWKRANFPGFGVIPGGFSSTRGITVYENYDGKIYAEAQDATNGVRIFRYDGSTDFSDIGSFANQNSWTQVNTNGFDGTNYNMGAGELIEFDPSTDGEDTTYLYAGTWTTDAFGILGGDFQGCEIWRYDGSTWEEVVGRDNIYGNLPGFGDDDNGIVMSVEVFNGALYVGTQNFGDRAEIWRTSDGTTWECVVPDGFGGLNMYIWRMIEYDGKLIIGTLNPLTGCELLMSETGNLGTFETFAVNGMDGSKTLPILSIPIHIADQYGVRSVAIYQDSLIVGTASFGDWVDQGLNDMIGDLWHPLSPYVGCEIWKLSSEYIHITKEYINCDTRIYLNATDMGIDPCISDKYVIHYQVLYDGYDTGPMQGGYNEDISFTFCELSIQTGLPLKDDCKHTIMYYAVDCLGNTEDTLTKILYVDCTPPEFIIHKPVDGWYKDGASIPAVVWAEDPYIKGCSSGIEEGSQGEAFLIDIFPHFKIIPLDTTNFLYDYDSHEYIGNVVIPDPSGIKDGTVLFVAGGQDNVGNGANSLITLLKAYFDDAMTTDDPEAFFADVISDFIANRNIVFIGIDNTLPEVEIILPEGDADIGLGPFEMHVTATDGLTGINQGTTAQVTLADVFIGSLTYNEASGMWEGTLSVPLDIRSGLQYLNVTIPDDAGNIGMDSIQVLVGARPGPLATAVDVQPDPSVIEIDGTGEILTVTGTIQSIYPGRYVDGAEYFIQIDKPDEADYGTGISMSPDTGYAWGDVTVDVIETFDSTDMDDGTHTVWVHGIDQYGSWGTFDEEEFNLVLETHWRPIFCEITEPGEDEQFDMRDPESCERYVTVLVDVHYWDDWTYSDMEDLIGNVKVWLDSPYGAPDQYFDVDYDDGLNRFVAEIPVYMYSNGSQLDIEAKAEDQWGNKESDDVQIEVLTTIIFDQWMEKEWNILSLPQYTIACSNKVENVLASINNGNFDLVYHFDPDTVPHWTSWSFKRHINEEPQTLTHMYPGKIYYLHIAGYPVRFFTDISGPYLEITYPEDEYEERCEGPGSLNFFACDKETWVTGVSVQIYDETGEKYWNGESWQTEPIWVEAELDGEDWYLDTEDIWEPGHLYLISAKAIDAGGCESEVDTAELYILKPEVLIEKTVGDGQEEETVPIDGTVTFTLYVENTGDVDFYDLEIDDYLLENLEYVDDSAMYSYNGGTEAEWDPDDDVYWDWNDDFYVGDILIITFDVIVTSSDVWEENIAMAFGDSECYEVEDSDTASVMGIDECEPDVDVDKQVWREDMGYWDDYTEQDIGDIVTFNISIHNDGSCLFTGLYVVDDLPAELAYVPGSAVVTFLWDAENMYEQESGAEVQPAVTNNPDGSTTLTWGEQTGEPDVEFGLPYCAYIYIEFDAQVVECGYHTNEVYAEAYYTCCDYDWGDGSAEVWVDECPEVFDFGDAPDTYGTLLASDGARHEPFAPYMGASSDIDADGQPTPGADGDDNDGNDDEDGIIFNGPYYPGDLGNADIDMTGTPVDGYLNAWIDFNQDGDFDDAGEQIFTDLYLTFGIVHMGQTFAIPGDALLGETYARFRINSQGGLGPTGPSPDGEVEDYTTTIEEPEYCPPVFTVTKDTWCYFGGAWTNYGCAAESTQHTKFRIILENTGTCPMAEVWIEDYLPENLQYVTDSYQLTMPGGITLDSFGEDSNILHWIFNGILMPGEKIEVIFEAGFVGGGEPCCFDTNWAYGYARATTGGMEISAYDTSDVAYDCYI